MKEVFVISRLDPKGRTIVPKAVREALGIGPDDQINYSIRDGRVLLTGVKKPLSQEDPFACFDKWASEADTEGYAAL